MSHKKCCFIGQSEIQENIGAALTDLVEDHIVKYGVKEFMVENAGLFDLIAASAVGAAKMWHRDVKLYLMQPSPSEQERAMPNMEDFDDTVCPERLKGLPREQAIAQLHQLMLQDSDYVIAYVTHPEGRAAAVLEQAREWERQGKLVITNLGDFSKFIKADAFY